MLTFSKALPLFAAIITLIYIFLLLSLKKTRKIGYGRLHSASLIAAYASASLGAILTLFFDFRESMFYFILLAFTTFFIITLSSHLGSRGKIFLLFYPLVMWQIMVLYDQVSETGIALGEGTHMIRSMVEAGGWSFNMAHNPTYNPLPTVAFIIASLSYLTSLPYYSWLLVFVVFYFYSLIVMYDLILLLLTKELTGSYGAGILAALLLTVTPESNPLMHPYQWLGNLLVLVSTWTFIRCVREREVQYGLICLLSYSAAILTHQTAEIEVFLPYTALAIGYIMIHVLKLRQPSPSNFSRDSKIMMLLGALILAVTSVRTICVPGYLEYIQPMVVNFFRDIFLPKPPPRGGVVWRPLYERAGVNPMQAYAWAYAVSLATAFILVELFKRRVRLWHLALYVLAATFLLAGYLQAVISTTPTVKLNRLVYVSIPFILPLAGLALAKTLKAGRWVAVISLILAVMAAPIAAQDPNISWRQYVQIRGGEYHPLTSTDIMEAQEVLPLLQTEQGVAIRSETFKVPVGGHLSLWRSAYTNSLKSALGELAFIYECKLPKISVVIEEKDWLRVNRVYDSGRSSIYSPP